MAAASPNTLSLLMLLIRRLRMPLITLIGAYAVSIIGFVLIPGMDNEGKPWRMDFFHAFYFVSFMGTTIGFGEIPYPFTPAQRMWSTFTIYITVVGWLYAIGSLFAMIQDNAFRRVLKRVGFERAVRRISEPFYLICGYGDTGSLLVRALAENGIRSSVIDRDPSRIEVLQVEELPLLAPGLNAHAGDADTLLLAGMRHPNCAGVAALTNIDHVNLKIAITCKLLNPSLRVICRAENHDAEANMASFGTDVVVNPFDTFAARFAMAIHSPSMYLIYEWMTSDRNVQPSDLIEPPRGTWVLCGFGRFGKSVQRFLSFEGIKTVIIEAQPEKTNVPEGTIIGRGTEAVTLREAKIEDAVGIIAGTDDDANNLSIIMTARDLNRDLFTVARQNERSNDPLFEAANVDIVMQRGNIIAKKIQALITTPLLSEFLLQARRQNNEWANILVSRISGIIGNQAPKVWTVTIDANQAPAVTKLQGEGLRITLADITTYAQEGEAQIPCIPVLLKRGSEEHLLPESQEQVEQGDAILFVGHQEAENAMAWNLGHYNTLAFVLTGDERPTGAIWRFLSRTGS